jgi:hypothetical protein
LRRSESGALPTFIGGPRYFNSFLSIGANNLQLNPATRTAWTLGPKQQQLAPFAY